MSRGFKAALATYLAGWFIVFGYVYNNPVPCQPSGKECNDKRFTDAVAVSLLWPVVAVAIGSVIMTRAVQGAIR